MGYWNQSAEGQSLQAKDTGLIWGDTPADIMSDAVAAIRAAFQDSVGRDVTPTELLAGLKFTLGGLEGELPDGHPFLEERCTSCGHLAADHEFLVGTKWTCDDAGCDDSLEACSREA